MSNNAEHMIPFSPEAEEAVLGAILTHPAIFHTVSAIISTNDFFLLRHKWVWQAIATCDEAFNDFDYLIVGQALSDQGHLDDLGGVAFLMRLINNTPTSAHAEVYARLVRRAAVRRRLLDASETIRMAALNEELTIEQVTTKIEAEIFQTLAQGSESRTMTVGRAAELFYDQVIAVQANEREILGIPTGFRGLDELTSGGRRGRLTYIASRPGMGKTALLANLVMTAAKLDQRVYGWTGEMDVLETVGRYISAEAEIDNRLMQTGNMSDKQVDRFTEVSLVRMKDWKVWIDDKPGITVENLRSQCLRHASLHGLDMVVVDYSGLLKTAQRTGTRNDEVAAVSRQLKELAMELNVPVYAAVQLSRKVEERDNKRPMLSDLRDSGSLEQDGDLVIFIYRDDYYNPESEFPNQAEIIVAKHRQGPTGTIVLYWDRTITRFRDATQRTINLSRDNGNNPFPWDGEK